MSDELGFNSKADLGLLAVALGVVAICVWLAAAFWEQDTGISVVLIAVGVLFPLWLMLSLRYFMSDDTLRIRCGPFKWRIPIAAITSVEPVRSVLSAPALSLDRLRIDYSGRSVMISPEPRGEFLRQLEHRRQHQS
ncbi:MAG: PH domain-containing protein [Gammaproteobacteria bacterium]|nr:PH domain-containing protein [Gammaproteobacteria bacterium]